MRYLSVCSGIEAATVAWHPLRWAPAAFSEIEAFPRAVLSHHYPDVPLHGDFTTIEDEYGPIDLLVGGTPCQSFSVAGLRGGLADDRGNLSLQFLKLAQRTRPRWLVWENVPGVLSSNGGRDFGSILGGMVELGYGIAYRVLDAQFFGVPQRRRRVFVVGHLGDWRRAAAVLFERHSLSGDTPPRREKGQKPAPCLSAGPSSGGRKYGLCADTVGSLIPSTGEAITFDRQSSGEYGTDPVASTISARDYKGPSDLVAHSLTRRYDSSEDGSGRGTPLVPVAFAQNSRDEVREISGNIAGALAAEPGMKQQTYICFSAQMSGTQASEGKNDLVPSLQAKNPMAVAFTASEQANSYAWERDVYPTLNAQIPNDSSNIQQGVRLGSAVRRLTPRECERLQGFPDDYTLIPYRGKPAADGPRYKALGNSMAVPVMRWIGERIDMVEAICAQARAA